MNDINQEFPLSLLRPRRKITGMSAILLPFLSNGEVDWIGFDAHLKRTVDAGLMPAVNMDTGYANLISEEICEQALVRAKAIAPNQFVAGAYVADQRGQGFDFDQYARQIELITSNEGIPVIFQSFGLTQQEDDEIVKSYEQLGDVSGKFVGFELGTMFAPFGKIYSLDVYEQLIKLPTCMGAKHSSLERELEWERLRLRDRVRPEFLVLTGNDLAIDMVMYGSDYLLGLSTFAPDLFAKRDAMWEQGDSQFHMLNDALQYLGFFAFRHPVPAYKHSAAMFLKLRNWIETDRTHPQSPTRPVGDMEILRELLRYLSRWIDS